MLQHLHLHGVKVQDLALHLVEHHRIVLSPSVLPLQMPLQSLPTIQQINNPAQFAVVCRLSEGLNPLFQVIDKGIEQDQPKYTCEESPAESHSIHHHSLGSSIQPVFYPVNSTSVQASDFIVVVMRESQ